MHATTDQHQQRPSGPPRPAADRDRPRPTNRPASLTDLVTAVGSGRPGAWDDLVVRLLPGLRAALGRFNVDRALRDDAESEALRSLFEHLGSIDDPERLPGWIARVANNALIDLLRVDQRQRAVALAEATDATTTTVDRDRVVESEVRDVLAGAVGRLSPREQLVVTSRLLTDEPESLKSIQARTGVPSGAIGPTLGRSLSKLRRDPDLRHLLA